MTRCSFISPLKQMKAENTIKKLIRKKVPYSRGLTLRFYWNVNSNSLLTGITGIPLFKRGQIGFESQIVYVIHNESFGEFRNLSNSIKQLTNLFSQMFLFALFATVFGFGDPYTGDMIPRNGGSIPPMQRDRTGPQRPSHMVWKF